MPSHPRRPLRLLALSLLTAVALVAAAAGPVRAQSDQPLPIEVRKGTVVRLDRPAAAIFIADPAVADVQAQGPQLVYLYGKRAGMTTIIAVDENQEVILRRDVEVRHDLTRLRAALEDAAPSSLLAVRSIDGAIVVEGDVAEPRLADDLQQIAARFLGENETLVNRLVVTAPTQVNLQVRVAEVAREATRVLGFNWDVLLTPGDFIFGLATGRDFITADGVTRIDAGTALGGYSSGSTNVNALLDALARDGLVTVLAQPNLTALSGETASFLAGGEFPVPVGADNNEIQIEFKQFGVSLDFTPTVLGGDRISLRVRPEVSDINPSIGIRVANIEIPGVSTRRAETTVELGSGQSFAIGGLISSVTKTNLDKFPGLGDVPILGQLFRSTRFQLSETELVIIVTPYLVRPTSPARLATPLDGFAAESGLARLLAGRLSAARLPTGSSHTAAAPQLVGGAGFALE